MHVFRRGKRARARSKPNDRALITLQPFNPTTELPCILDSAESTEIGISTNKGGLIEPVMPLSCIPLIAALTSAPVVLMKF